MQTHDLGQFAGLLAELSELYGRCISSGLTEIYWKALQMFEWVDVKAAFEAHARNPDCGQFFPKPADIVRFIEGNGETRALKAWATVEKALQCVGVYQSVAFDDAFIHAVIEDMGGWVKLCTMTNDDLPFRAREFQKRYMGFVIKKPLRYPKCLYGLSNCENAKNGYAVEPPLLIGDAAIAEQVMLNGGGVPLIVQQARSVQDLLQHTVKQLEEESHESD
jgi:hypothetical protein